MSLFPNRTWYALHHKVSQLGLVRYNVAPWSDGERKIVRESWATKSKKEIQSLLPNRTWPAISGMVKNLRKVEGSIPHLSVNRYLRYREGTLNPLTEVERAYIAGLIEGDGSISITRGRSCRKLACGQTSCTPKISIGNTNKELLAHVKTLLQGSCSITNKKPKARRKQLSILEIGRLLDIKSLLQQLIPFLVGRKKQAELVLEFCNLRLNDKWGEYNPRLFGITEEVQMLNKKGKLLSRKY